MSLREHAAVALLLLAMGAAQLSSALQETQTWDEAGHLTAGYLYLKTGHAAFYTDHPPLRAVFALPLLFLHMHIPFNRPEWARRDQTAFATQFLYTNPYHPDTLLLAGRSVAIALSLAFGLVLFTWTRRHFGSPAALIALAMFAVEPNLIAHGHYITTDMLAAFTFFLAAIAWRPAPVLPGIALGVALVAKFSAIALVPIFVLLGLAALWQGRTGWRRLAVLLAANFGIAAVTVAILCFTDLSSYLTGLDQVIRKGQEGHEAYLLGQFSHTGWWYYFPVVFAVKTPVGLLLLLGIALGGLAWRRPAWKNVPAAWLTMAIPAVTFFAISMMSAVNIGVRHILPIYPMLCALGAALVTRLPRGIILGGVCVAIAVFESASIYPNYLSFFNAAAGGPAAGPHYLLDSNIDWGQDVKKLRTWLRARNIASTCMFYFGNTGVEFYGIPMEYLPRTNEIDLRRNLDCVASISVTNLYGLYVPHDAYTWLRDREPMAKIGWSIYVYDLRRKVTP